MKNKVNFISVQEAAENTGLSETVIREGVSSGRFPAIRTSSKQSKILIDEQMFLQVLRNESLGNVKNGEERSYLASLFQKPADEDDENITPPSATFTP